MFQNLPSNLTVPTIAPLSVPMFGPHLDEPIVHLADHLAPFLFLGRHQLADQVLELTPTFCQRRGALGDSLREGLVEVSDLLAVLPHDGWV
jgi:hypothetical protein